MTQQLAPSAASGAPARAEPHPISVPPALAGPYPGLRPFQKHEWPIFFGREPMIDAVLDRLAATRLVVVHGSSGCGKSSLIKAGVLPRLEQEHSRYGVSWRTAEMRPGSSPLWNLATAIARLHEQLEGDAEPTLETTRTVRRLLNGGRDALARIRERFGLGRDGNVCLLLDQFEELFRYARDIGREEAQALIEVLRGFEPGGEGPPKGIHAIVTMRSDHLGDCGHFEGFAELVNATQYLLPRIRDDALLRAIREPARLFGGEVAADLAVRLVDESRAEIDALPLVQHALMRLWRQAGGATDQAPRPRSNPGAPHPVLTAEAYSGLEPLLSEHAEEVLDEVEAAYPGSAKVTEHLFRALTEIDAEGRGIRRPRKLSELVGATGGDPAALARVIERFARPDCGFLVRSSDQDPVIDLGHEALIRCWRKLDDPTIEETTRPAIGWLQRAAAAARIWRHTATTRRPRGWLQREREDARIWRSLLYQAEAGDRISPAVLKDREAWFESLPGPDWAERYDGGWDRVNKLLTSSRNAARRQRRVLIGGAALFAVGALILVALTSWSTIGVSPRMGLAALAVRVGLGRLVAPEMIELPAGTFTMGSTEAERQWAIEQGAQPEWVAREAPPHDVEIKQPFAISKYEVTFDDWDLCVADGGCNGYGPSDQDWGRGRRPVINVSWDDAKAYVQWLSKVTGDTYRLPSEAEWEYAARAGTTTPFSLPAPDGSDDIAGQNLANCDGCGSEWDGRQTAPVGSFAANGFGLHDMAGNVWEWVEDCWHDSYAEEGRPDDGSAWVSGDCSRGVLRGGSWVDRPRALRSANRVWLDPDDRDAFSGFRVARTLSRSESVTP